LYTVAGLRGSAHVDASFDTRLADPNPPFLASVSVLTNGVVADSIGVRAGQQRVLGFDLRDDQALATAAASYRLDSREPWVPLALTQDAAGFSAALPDTLIGYVSLRIQGADASGNRLDYTIEPAVFMTPDLVDVPDAPAPVRLALAGATPNPARHRFTVS